MWVFFFTPIGCMADTSKGLTDYLKPAGGIWISRRPNIRASNEKAPGPRQAVASANAVILRTRKLETTKPPGFVIPKKWYATMPKATIKLAIGVITPNKRHKPAAKENEATINALKSGQARRNCAPLNMITLATTARSNNKPKPGHPRGNVVKSLCSEISPKRWVFGLTLVDFSVRRIHRRW